MPTSKEYWTKRKAQNMWEYMERAEDCADEIDKIYDEAYKYLKGESNKIFTRVKDRYNLSDKEAEKILNKSKSLDINDVKKELKKGIPTEEKTKLLAEIESPAYAFRLKRFERMQNNIDDLMTNVYKREKKASTKHYTELAKESYDKSNYDIQQRLNKGFEVPRLNEKKIDKLLKSKWSGENYSKRIWGRTQDVADKLKREMVVSLMTGKTNREVAKSIEERFGSTAYQARRLVRTESCYIANQTEIMSYKDSGIDKYEYCATLDLRTSPQCQKLDGKVFNVDDAQAGVNLPPMHPFCRSTTLAYFDDDIEDEVNEELGEAEETRRAYIPEKGNSELIENMSYEEWKKRYVVDEVEDDTVRSSPSVSEKSEKGIEKTSESGIMKLGSDTMDLENQRYGRNKDTLVNHTYIESGEYRRKFDKATDNKEVNKTLYDSAKMALKHRSGTVFEDMYWIDGITGKIILSVLNSDVDRGIVYTDKIKNTIRKKENIITIHTHPGSMPPSAADFNSCYLHGYSMGFVACHNGKVFGYTANEQVNPRLMEAYIEEFIKYGNNEFDSQIMAIEKVSEMCDIKMWEVK